MHVCMNELMLLNQASARKELDDIGIMSPKQNRVQNNTYPTFYPMVKFSITNQGQPLAQASVLS